MPALSEVPRAAMTANRGRRDRNAAGDRGECRRRRVEQPPSGGRLLEDLVPQPHAMSPCPRESGVGAVMRRRQGHDLTEPARIPRDERPLEEQEHDQRHDHRDERAGGQEMP